MAVLKASSHGRSLIGYEQETALQLCRPSVLPRWSRVGRCERTDDTLWKIKVGRGISLADTDILLGSLRSILGEGVHTGVYSYSFRDEYVIGLVAYDPGLEDIFDMRATPRAYLPVLVNFRETTMDEGGRL